MTTSELNFDDGGMDISGSDKRDLSEISGSEIENKLEYNSEEELLSSSHNSSILNTKNPRNRNKSRSNSRSKVSGKSNKSEDAEVDNEKLDDKREDRIDPYEDQKEVPDFIFDDNKINELLFCVQGIGKLNPTTKEYDKGTYCEASLRDIHRFLRKDDSENPKTRLYMLKWKVCENEITPLILNYENNDKIQQLGIVILVDMTEGLAPLCENKNFYMVKLTELQEFIANSKLIDHLSSVLAEASRKLKEATEIRKKVQSPNFLKLAQHSTVQTTNENGEIVEDPIDQDEFILKQAALKKQIAEIENKSQQTIELIFVLFKQLFNIYDSNDLGKNSSNCVKMIKKMSEYKIFEAIVFHCQTFETEFYKRLAMHMLELTFYIIREFSVTQIFENSQQNQSLQNQISSNSSKDPKPLTLLQKLREEEKMQKQQRQSLMPTRHNNFGTTIQVIRPLDKSSYKREIRTSY